MTLTQTRNRLACDGVEALLHASLRRRYRPEGDGQDLRPRCDWCENRPSSLRVHVKLADTKGNDLIQGYARELCGVCTQGVALHALSAAALPVEDPDDVRRTLRPLLIRLGADLALADGAVISVGGAL